MGALRSCRQGSVLGLAVLAILAGASPTSAQHGPKIEITLQVPHSGLVTSVAFSPDGTRLLSGSKDRTLKLWDVATGRLIRTFEGHSDEVNSVAFSPDGTRLLSGSEDRTLKLWDAATGEVIRTLTFKGRPNAVASVAFSRDGAHLLSGNWDKTLKLWDAATGQFIRTFEGHSDQVCSVAFSPDGTRLLSGSRDKTLKLWDAATGQFIRSFEGHSDRVCSVAFSSDGTRLLSGSEDGTLKLWDAATGQLIRTFEGHSDRVLSVAISPDGVRLLSGSVTTLKLWNAATGQLIRTLEGHAAIANSVAFSPDGTRLLSSSVWTLKLWDAATGLLIRTFEGHANLVSSVAFSPDGTRLLSSSVKTLKLWDAATGLLIRTIEGHSASVNSVAFSPDGTRLLSGSEDRTLKLWDAATGQVIQTFEGHSDRVLSVAFSPDGTRLLSGSGSQFRGGGQFRSRDDTLKLWDAATGRLIRTFEGHANMVSSVAFSPDGARLLSGSDDGTLKLWDAATGQVILTIAASQGRLNVAFSPDGVRLLSGSIGTLKLWDAATGRLVRTFEGNAGRATSVAFSPDGTRLVSGTWDKTLKLWDTATGQVIQTFEGHSGTVESVGFSPDGTRLVSASTDTTIRIWGAAVGGHIATLIGSRGGKGLALTPAGFFAGSRAVNELFGIVRGLEVTSIDQVHQSLFNPDLVREALAGDPGGEVKEAAKIINLEKVLDSGPAPIIAIASPSEGSQSANDLATVTARIEERGKGIGRVEWRVNGITAAVGVKPPGRGPVYMLSQQLALDPGDNVVEVVAYNASNLLASLPANTTIKFTGTTDRTQPKLHILAIGINAYVDRGSPLRFGRLGLAVKDATAFAESMKKAAAGLYEEIRVTLALDGNANRDKLDEIITKISSEIHPRDSLILFAAGHGTSENGRFYFIPQDYQSGPGNLARHAIGQDHLQDWLANRIKAKRAIILLDTCESGALVAGHARSRADAPASEAAVGRLHEATGRPVLTAAAAGQFAHEGLIGASGERHGVFTWAVLDALRRGDSNGNGTIELTELVRHVQSVVPKIAAELGGKARAATSEPVYGMQAARFGSRGEDFVVARRLP